MYDQPLQQHNVNFTIQIVGKHSWKLPAHERSSGSVRRQLSTTSQRTFPLLTFHVSEVMVLQDSGMCECTSSLLSQDIQSKLRCALPAVIQSFAILSITNGAPNPASAAMPAMVSQLAPRQEMGRFTGRDGRAHNSSLEELTFSDECGRSVL